ncbi:MAG TPA: threonylcarbamoyl-AMP synthase [Syntrophus sp. (in: bacteria)]|nr:MAG: threonylcarbamoyl-AMP synthase [Syntrophus sp. GWC2_56_31]HBB16356.1 threonylcarbamoyl-AMP synthase [Syntrophus sp. (in: bacteria)]
MHVDDIRTDLNEDGPPNAPGQIARAVVLLRSGGVVAFPTETVYGLGADATNDDALRRIFSIKGRPADHPLIVHLAASVQIRDWARDIPSAAYALAERFWPGPLTLILRRRAWVSALVTGGQETIGLRVPAHPVALELLSAFGGGVAAPSANRFGRVSPTSAEHVRQELGDGPDMILEGGACSVGIESTIVSLIDGDPVILRPGGISPVALEQVTGRKVARPGIPQTVRVPGTMASHYAPAAPLRLVGAANLPDIAARLAAKGKRAAIMALSGYRSTTGQTVAMPPEPAAYGYDLYAVIRMLDSGQHDAILVETPPQTEAWLAVNDRLQRASGS